jgi:Fe-S-cluster containining protein
MVVVEQTCLSCSADCCRGTLIWSVEKREELKPVREMNEAEVQAFLAEAKESWKPVGTYGICNLLTPDGDCSTYAERPALCRVWHCGGAHWRPKE